MNRILAINEKEEIQRITKFIGGVFKEQKIKYAIIGLSGGIDSSTSFALLTKSIPQENIIPVHLPFFDIDKDVPILLKSLKFPQEKLINFPIEDMVEAMSDELEISEDDLVRRGNVMARIRMIVLFDLAKRVNGLVVGTENRSEFRLGYYTRHGDEASDIEPLRHLYKSQIYELANILKIPEPILRKRPSAGLWENQTDEGEFGFEYKEADQVLYLHYEKGLTLKEIEKQGYKKAKKILDYAKRNSHKHKVPYSLD